MNVFEVRILIKLVKITKIIANYFELEIHKEFSIYI